MPVITGLVNQKKQAGKSNLYLVGFMGVGKSVIGQRVALELGYQFFDSDAVIEKKIGKKIPEIFATEGESGFRAYEREFIDFGHPTEGCVISCGGGLISKSRDMLVCFHRNHH